MSFFSFTRFFTTHTQRQIKEIDCERTKKKPSFVEIRRLCSRDMVFRGDTVMSVAHLSADIFQRLRLIRPSDRISSGEMLQLVCCFPLQQLGRFVLWFWNYICVPPPEILYFDGRDDNDDDGGYGSSSSSSLVTHHNYYHLHLEWRNFLFCWFVDCIKFIFFFPLFV